MAMIIGGAASAEEIERFCENLKAQLKQAVAGGGRFDVTFHNLGVDHLSGLVLMDETITIRVRQCLRVSEMAEGGMHPGKCQKPKPESPKPPRRILIDKEPTHA